MSSIPVSVQLWTLRDEVDRDFVGTLRKVAEIGYAGVEFAGYGAFSAGELRKVLDDLGLKASGSHVGIEALIADLPRQMDYCREIGSEFLICPWLPDEMRTDAQAYLRTAETLDRIGAECRRNGLAFCYHNHDFEFQRFDGKYGLDILYEATNPQDVQAQLDVYWVKRGGGDPAAYIRKYAGRCPLVHLKDMADDADRSFAEVGTGILDFDSIFTACQEAGVRWYVVEQDVCKRPPLESVRISFENLRARGIA